MEQNLALARWDMSIKLVGQELDKKQANWNFQLVHADNAGPYLAEGIERVRYLAVYTRDWLCDCP